MRKPIVVLDFIHYSVSEKVTFYRNVNDKLFGNLIYATPDVTAAEAKSVVAALEAAILAAKDGGHTAISARHDAEKQADEIYKKLANYLDRIAAGDETRILSSGFHISKQLVITPKPELAALDGEHSGDVKLVGKAKERAAAYHWQMSKESDDGTDGVWVDIGTSTRATFLVSGLQIIKRYKFRYAVVTPDGTSDYCEPVSKIIV
jgi:hypothetical protein